MKKISISLILSVLVSLSAATAQTIADGQRYTRNEEFEKGNFTAAVKCYTKCLGLKVFFLLFYYPFFSFFFLIIYHFFKAYFIFL
jgi:hypothetical protein